MRTVFSRSLLRLRVPHLLALIVLVVLRLKKGVKAKGISNILAVRRQRAYSPVQFCYSVRGSIEIRHQFLVLIRRLVDAEQLSVAGFLSARGRGALPLKLAAL